MFDSAAVEGLLARHDAGRDLGIHLWTLVSFELWARRFLDDGGRVSVPAEHGVPFVLGPAADAAPAWTSPERALPEASRA